MTRGGPAVIGAKIAIQTKCLAQPLKQALHTARRLDADGVQIDLRTELPAAELSDTGRRQLRKILDDLNLRVGSVAFPTRRGYAEPHELDRRIEATIAAMRQASQLGSAVMSITLGALPEDPSGQTTLREALSMLGAQSHRLGVRLAAQTAGTAPAEVARLIAELPDGTIGVELSPADLIHAGRQPPEFVHTLGRHIEHVLANDATRGLRAGGVADVELGRGSAELPELLGALEEFDYRGWLTVERRNSPRAVEEAESAVRFLRSL
jgi:sugar phosphate isomerase/epimerase